MAGMAVTGVIMATGTGPRAEMEASPEPSRKVRGMVMPAQREKATRTTEVGHERSDAGLRALVAGHYQFTGVHHLRFQFRKATVAARLALVWRVLRVPDRALHRDVWIPVDDLSVVGLA